MLQSTISVFTLVSLLYFILILTVYLNRQSEFGLSTPVGYNQLQQ